MPKVFIERMKAFQAAWLCALLLAGAVLGQAAGDLTDGAGRAVPPVPEPLFPYNGAPYVPAMPTLACKQVVDPDGDVVTYEFCLDDQNDFSSPLFTASPGSANDTSFTIGTDWAGSLSSNTTYYWRARARDVSGPSAWSSGWSFRVDSATFTFDDVVAGVSNGTEQKYWNYTDVVWRSFAHANGVFAENGLKVWLSVSEIYRYYGEDWPEAQSWEGHSRDLLVLFDEGSGFGGYLSAGWYIIGQSFIMGPNGIASEAGMDALMHELGHYRGVRDLYLYNVAPGDNGVVPGMGHRYTDKNPPDLMDYPYGVHAMQNYTRALINQTGNSTRADTDFDIWHGAFCPELNYILVKDKMGAPIPRADVKIYTSAPYQNLTGGFTFGSSLDAIPEKSGTTGADGAFLFGEKSGGKLDFSFDLCFVSASFNDTTEYAFLESVETGGLFWGYKEAPLLLNGSIFDVFYSDGAPPGSPQGFDGVAGNGYAVLTWDPPASDGRYPVTGYRIFRGNESGNETLYASLGNVTSFKDTALAPFQRYYYRASAVNVAGEGPKGARINAISTTSKPGPPRNLQALAGDGRALLTWEAPSSDGGSPVTGYRICRGMAGEDRTFLAQIGNLTTYEDTGLTNGAIYRYTVAAQNIAGLGGDSFEAMAVPAALPGPPRDLRATAGDGQITLNWTEPLSDGGLAITIYLVYRGISPGATSLLKEIEDIGTHAFVDRGLTNGITYYYSITARTGAGEGASSEEIDATPFTRPGEPRDPRATDGDGRARLSWKAPEQDGGAAILKYRIYRGEETGEATFLRDLKEGLEFHDTGLTNGKIYYYRVSAFNKAGEGPLSDEARAAPAAVPSAPRDLKADAGDGRVKLTWKAPDSDGGAAISNYSIYRGNMAGAETFLLETGNELSFTDIGLTNGRPYYYVVKARNRMGESPFSAEAAALPVAPVPVKYRLGGHVYAQGTDRPIPGAVLSLPGGNSTAADSGGGYFILLEEGNYTITVSAAGYSPSSFNITMARADIVKDLYLSKVAADGGREPPNAPAYQLWPVALLVVVITLVAVVLVIGLRRRGKAAG